MLSRAKYQGDLNIDKQWRCEDYGTGLTLTLYVNKYEFHVLYSLLQYCACAVDFSSLFLNKVTNCAFPMQKKVVRFFIALLVRVHIGPTLCLQRLLALC